MPDFSYKFYQVTAEAWESMYQAILSAKFSIYWEIYIFVDDDSGTRFVDLLCKKAEEGVDVKIILDSIGSADLSATAISRLRLAGVDLKWYNYLSPEWHLGNWFRRVWQRNHRKVLIVDEKVAFLGGVNIRSSHREWNDVFVRLEGVVLRRLLRSFAKCYIYCDGDKKKVWRLLHPKLSVELKDWKDKIKFIMHSPIKLSRSNMHRVYHNALAVAKDSFDLISPYYVPDLKFLRLIKQAKKRGVRVNIFLPERADHKIMDWITGAFFSLTIKAGASVYLLKKMNHGKAFVVDGKSGFVGSTNFTHRSFAHNEEAGVYFENVEMVGDLQKMFEDFKLDAELIDGNYKFKKGYWGRFKDWWWRNFEKYV